MDLFSQFPSGTNIRLCLAECRCGDLLLTDGLSTKESVWQAIESVGFQAVKHIYHNFEGAGYTSTYILAESHLVIHTWPEYNGLVLVEMSVCDFKRGNRDLALLLSERIAAIFQPSQSTIEILPMIPAASEILTHS